MNQLGLEQLVGQLKTRQKLELVSLRASSPGRSGRGAGKAWKWACNYVSGIWISALKNSRCEVLIGGDDFSNDVITLRMCYSMFVYICTRFPFPLIGGNLTAQSTGSHRGIGGGIKFQSSFREVVASSPSFSRPAARAPRRACKITLRHSDFKPQLS